MIIAIIIPIIPNIIPAIDIPLFDDFIPVIPKRIANIAHSIVANNLHEDNIDIIPTTKDAILYLDL